MHKKKNNDLIQKTSETWDVLYIKDHRDHEELSFLAKNITPKPAIQSICSFMVRLNNT